jgi:DHA1 family bicyclomycin/chloramphenicol resistance-like MFS transporter
MKAAPSGRTIILLLALCAMLGSLATQLLVPALPRMASDLGADTRTIQLVIGLYLAGLGAGQLIAGPLSDRFGRKPVLLGGLLLFVAGSAIAAITSNMMVILGARVLQALGAAAGVVASRVMVADYFPAHEIAARQATLMAVVLLSPAAAPVIGGLIAETLGWRAIFAGLVVLALVNAALAVPMLPVPDTARRTADSLRVACRSLGRNRQYLWNVAAIAAGSAALYTYLAAAPFVLDQGFGLGPRDSGLCLLLVAASSIAGTRLVRRLDRTGGGQVAGAMIMTLGALLLFVLGLSGLDRLMPVLLGTAVLGVGAGVAGPSGIGHIIQSSPGNEGTAASLAGAAQMLTSALAAGTVGHAATLGTIWMGGVLTALASFSLLAAWQGHR